MKRIEPKDYKVTSTISLSDLPTDLDLNVSEKKKIKALENVGELLSKQQDTLYSHNKYSVLICLQGMDTAGKDSLIREVFKEFNPRGVVVHSFKTPSSKELEHDYLWRHYIALPERGKFGVFNRTHYENVLVTRVHPEYLLNENLPGIEKVEDVTDEFWEKRFDQINQFEKHIVQNGTILMKFFLNLSKEEQRKRLVRRLEKKKHNWKFSPGDLKERDLWTQYMRYYEEAINKTSNENAPWYIVPADSKETARYLVARIIYEEMCKYSDIQEPELDEDIQKNIKFYHDKLLSEKS